MSGRDREANRKMQFLRLEYATIEGIVFCPLKAENRNVVLMSRYYGRVSLGLRMRRIILSIYKILNLLWTLLIWTETFEIYFKYRRDCE